MHPASTKPSLLKIPVFVISLKNSPRRLYIQEHLKNLNISFEFFDASLGLEHLEKFQTNYKTIFSEKLSNGQVGCICSHLGVYQKIIDLNLPQALILEDDIVIKDAEKLRNQLSWLLDLKSKIHWEVIRSHIPHQTLAK